MAALALALGVRMGKPGVYLLNPAAAVPGPATCGWRCGGRRWPARGLALLRRRRRGGGAWLSSAQIHGGTDSGPEPRWDFSTNANALGPCPAVLREVLAADLTRYPTRTTPRCAAVLAAYHATDAGSHRGRRGASELILRLVRAVPGPVLVLGPTFPDTPAAPAWRPRGGRGGQRRRQFLTLQRRHGGWDSVLLAEQPDRRPRRRLHRRRRGAAGGWGRSRLRAAVSAGAIDTLAPPRRCCFRAQQGFGLTGLRAAVRRPRRKAGRRSMRWRRAG